MVATETSTARALVVEDDDSNRLLLERYLADEGFDVVSATDGPAALQLATWDPPDVVILDLGLPGVDGLDVLRGIRRRSAVPVLVLTGRTDELDKLDGFDAGADDYMIKPFSLPEMAARLRALLRRGGQAGPTGAMSFPGLIVDVDRARVIVAGAPIALTRRELQLLGFLASRPGSCFSREELLRDVWGSTGDWQDPATVTEHVRRIRQKLQLGRRTPCLVENVRGVGYRFLAPPDAE